VCRTHRLIQVRREYLLDWRLWGWRSASLPSIPLKFEAQMHIYFFREVDNSRCEGVVKNQNMREQRGWYSLEIISINLIYAQDWSNCELLNELSDPTYNEVPHVSTFCDSDTWPYLGFQYSISQSNSTKKFYSSSLIHLSLEFIQDFDRCIQEKSSDRSFLNLEFSLKCSSSNRRS
jgi:hypothetical protein